MKEIWIYENSCVEHKTISIFLNVRSFRVGENKVRRNNDKQKY